LQNNVGGVAAARACFLLDSNLIASKFESSIRKKEGFAMSKQEVKKEKREIASWRPFTDLGRWEHEMERMFDDFLGRVGRPIWGERWWPAQPIGLSTPPLDLYEEKDEIVVKTELPGMAKEDIQVNITDHLLSIKGEKKREEETKEKNYYCCERSYGAISRTVELPTEVRGEKARASFKNGVLELHFPKTEEAKKKEVKVKVE
jgi:HSP20 family protein